MASIRTRRFPLQLPSSSYSYSRGSGVARISVNTQQSHLADGVANHKLIMSLDSIVGATSARCPIASNVEVLGQFHACPGLSGPPQEPRPFGPYPPIGCGTGHDLVKRASFPVLRHPNFASSHIPGKQHKVVWWHRPRRVRKSRLRIATRRDDELAPE